MENRTLLFYINSINGGGAARVLLQLAHHFAQAGYRSVLVTSFTGAEEYPVPEDVLRLTMEGEELRQSRLRRNVSRIAALRRLCREYKPAAVISFMAEPNMRALIATKGLDIPCIVSVRNDPKTEYRGRLLGFVGKHLIPRADGCVFQTEDAMEWFPNSMRGRSRVIFNDVDDVFFRTGYKGGRDIVTLGRLTEQKNHAMLIDAFAMIAGEFPDTDLRIYGRGELRDALEEKISALGLTGRVKLMGLTDNAPAVLSETGVFVLPSDYEGMPNALLEALAMGVPSISTDCPCGGPRTVIENGANGVLVPVGDRKAMADALRKVLSSPEYAGELGRNAKERAKEFRSDRVFLRWKEFVESVADGK